MRLLALGLLASLLTAQPLWAEETSRAALDKYRWKEDYSYLAFQPADQDLYDTIKHLDLNADGSAYLSLGGSLRERYEYASNPVFGQDPQDPGGAWLQRANLHLDLHWGPHVRVFTELSSALVEGRAAGPGPVDQNKLDLLNAFADLSLPLSDDWGVALRLGRQELEYGSGRLVDVREGTNVRRSFNAVQPVLTLPDWRVAGVAARPVRNVDGVFDDEANEGVALWGVYAVGGADLLPAGSLDLYYLGFHDDAGSFVQGTAAETRHSLGTRVWGAEAGWDWNWEAVFQFGTFGAGNIRAWTLASETGYTFDRAFLSPRLALRANIASGDKDENSPDLQTFNPLFPRGNYFSQAAVLGPRNFFNINPHLNLQITDSLSINADVNFYWRLSRQDGVYAPSGQIIRAPGGSQARYVATGISLEIPWQITRELDVAAIYTHLEPGSFIRQTGSDDPIDFVELTARFRF
ncbi:MAG: alginate export family protein [Pseudomonadota bacterium]